MKDDRIYLQHIYDAIQNIFDYTRDGSEAFFADRKTQDAVIRIASLLHKPDGR